MSDTKPYFVHESSYIDDGVEIGDGTQIWHFSHIMGKVQMGENCKIGQNVVIGPQVKLGNNVKIQNNVSVYQGVTLEDDVFCGPSMVFTNVPTPRCAFPRNTGEDFLPTVVKRGASIGANATIICGNIIGECALVGAGAVVTKDVKPYSIVYGNPARPHGWACECGTVLEIKDSHSTCPDCNRNYEIKNGEELLLLSANPC